MTVAEIPHSGVFAWGPGPVPKQGRHIAVVDASAPVSSDFSARGNMLQIYEVYMTGQTPVRVTSAQSPERFSCLTWGNPEAAGEAELSSGLIAGGLADGTVRLWSAESLVQGTNGDKELFDFKAHDDSITDIEFNKFGSNLLATAGTDGKWLLWDVNNESNPTVSTGVTAPHRAPITTIKWNPNVSPILGWAAADGRVVVWDLRTSKAAVSLSSVSCSALAWSPTNTTDMCIGTSTGVIQFWDVRKPQQPKSVINAHVSPSQNFQGVTSLAWSPNDSNFLVSCGKDQRTVMWNPNTGVETYELFNNSETSCVQWSPRTPGILAAAVGEQIVVSSLHDGNIISAPRSSLTGAFGGTDDAFSRMGAEQTETRELCKTAPAWLGRSAGAVFGFGGQLFKFSAGAKDFQLEKTSTDQNLQQRSAKFESVLRDSDNAAVAAFCDEHLSNAAEGEGLPIWRVLKAFTAQNPRENLVDILGFNPTSLRGEADAFRGLPADGRDEAKLAELIHRAVVVGEVQLAVDLSLEASRWDDALSIAALGGDAMFRRTQLAVFDRKPQTSFTQILRAVTFQDFRPLVNDFDAANNGDWRDVIATLNTWVKPAELAQYAEGVAQRLAQSNRKPEATVCHIAAGSIEEVVQAWLDELHASSGSVEALQEFIEKVALFQRLSEKITQNAESTERFVDWVGMLAAEGSLNSALAYLDVVNKAPDANQKVSFMRQRIQGALGEVTLPQALPQGAPEVQQPVAQEDPAAQYAAQQAAYAAQQAQQAQQYAQHQQAAAGAWPGQQQQQGAYPNQQQQPYYNQQGQQVPPAHQHQPVQPVAQPYQHQHQPQAYQHQHYQQPPTQPAPQPVQPTPTPAPVPQPVQPVPVAPVAPPVATSTGYTAPPAGFPPTGGPPGTPTQPTASFPPAHTAPPQPAAAAPAATFDASSVPAEYQGMVQALTAALQAIPGDPRSVQRRQQVEKALQVLYPKLSTSKVSAPVAQLLTQFANQVISGQDTKETIRTLTDQHWAEFGSIRNIKFLAP